jgi:deoxyribose-phosphate aldolase
VPFLRQLLAGETDIMVGAPVGFPSGAHKTEIKVAEARALITDGVQEMDMMLNVGKLRSGELGVYRDSWGQLALALNGASAAQLLSVSRGSLVRITCRDAA